MSLHYRERITDLLIITQSEGTVLDLLLGFSEFDCVCGHDSEHWAIT